MAIVNLQLCICVVYVPFVFMMGSVFAAIIGNVTLT